MDNIIAIFSDPANIAIIVAVLGALRAIGVVLEKIGAKIEGDDPFERAGLSIAKIVAGAGRILSYLGIGNPQRKVSVTGKK